jgi:predicted nuclease of predicted toxin-antitoxin system
MKLLFDESLSPRLVELLRDLFPESEGALRNGLVGSGDLRILEYAGTGGFVLVTTSCNYPTNVASDVLRRNAIRIAQLPGSHDRLIVLER